MSAGQEVAVTACRGCGAPGPVTVVDLGEQCACDHFPPALASGAPTGDRVPDPRWPLAVMVCPACGLAQLTCDSPAPEEPLAAPSATLAQHALDVSARLVERLGLPRGSRVLEYASSHGGDWQAGLSAAGMDSSLHAEDTGEQAPKAPSPGPGTAFDVVVDNMSIIHAEDLQPQLTSRVQRLAPGGRLVIEFHHAAQMVADGQFDAIRHGHPLYFTLTSWRNALAPHGLEIETAWAEDVFGGCLVAVARAGCTPDAAAFGILAAEAATGVTAPGGWGPLADRAASAAGLRAFLADQRDAGVRVAGYGAGSKAVTFLGVAGIDADLLPVVADLSPAKHGRRIPGTAVPIISPDELVTRAPDLVVVLTWDIAHEVTGDLRRRGLAGARYVVAQPALAGVD